MARKRPLTLHCPICKKLVRKRDPEFPFCSERCRLLDLGKVGQWSLCRLVAAA